MNKNLSTKFKGGARTFPSACHVKLYEYYKTKIEDGKILINRPLTPDTIDDEAFKLVRYLTIRECQNKINGFHQTRAETEYSKMIGGDIEPDDNICAKYFDQLIKEGQEPGTAFRTVHKLLPETCKIMLNLSNTEQNSQQTSQAVYEPQNNVQEEQETNKEKLKQEGGAKKSSKKSSKKVSKKGSKKVSKKGSKKVSKKGSKIILGGAKKSSKTSKTSKPKKSSKKSSKKSKKM
jgi:hypothetical protein